MYNIVTDQEIDQIFIMKVIKWSKMMSLELFEKSEILGPTYMIKYHFWVELVEFLEKCEKFTYLKFSKNLENLEVIVYIFH